MDCFGLVKQAPPFLAFVWTGNAWHCVAGGESRQETIAIAKLQDGRRALVLPRGIQPPPRPGWEHRAA